MIRHWFLIGSMLLLSGCGLKTGLVVYDDSAPAPELILLSHQLRADSVIVRLQIQGGSGAVLYQIDRAVIDPGCRCIGNWLRYYESSASEQHKQLQRHMWLRPDVSYAYRFRAVDSLGRKSVWSPVIRSDVPRTDVSPIEMKNIEHEKINE